MQVELKNVKFSEFASEETNCFQANVYIDGKKAGVVSNDGRGGPDRHEPFSLGVTLNAYAKTLPKYEFYGQMHEHNAETLIGELFDAYQNDKTLKSLLKRKFVYTVLDKHGIYSSSVNKAMNKTVTEVCEKYRSDKKEAELIAKLKADKLLNLMPYDEALALFTKHIVPLPDISRSKSEADPAYAF